MSQYYSIICFISDLQNMLSTIEKCYIVIPKFKFSYNYHGIFILSVENFVTLRHDVASLHLNGQIRSYLDLYFPGRWIGRRWAKEWSARSSDLSPNNLFVWRHFISKVFACQPLNLEDLKQRISQECRIFSSEILANVRIGFYRQGPHLPVTTRSAI